MVGAAEGTGVGVVVAVGVGVGVGVDVAVGNGVIVAVGLGEEPPPPQFQIPRRRIAAGRTRRHGDITDLRVELSTHLGCFGCPISSV